MCAASILIISILKCKNWPRSAQVWSWGSVYKLRQYHSVRQSIRHNWHNEIWLAIWLWYFSFSVNQTLIVRRIVGVNTSWYSYSPVMKRGSSRSIAIHSPLFAHWSAESLKYLSSTLHSSGVRASCSLSLVLRQCDKALNTDLSVQIQNLLSCVVWNV